MTPRYVRVTMYTMAALTLPLTWLLMRWSQSWGIPLSTFYTPGPPARANAAFMASVVPAALGALAFAFGSAGLFTEESGLRKFGPTSFAMVCGGIIAMGPLLGILFLAEGLNPINWIASPAVFVPIVLVVGFALATYLMREHMNDPYGFNERNRRRRHLTITPSR